MNNLLEKYCSESRSVLEKEPLDAALSRMATGLSKLLRDPEFVSFAFAEDAPKCELFHDPEAGFYVLAHVQPAGKSGKPHSHGESWAIYGIARGCTDMIEWRRVNPQSEERFVLTASDRYRLNVGETRSYGPGVIHSTSHPEASWVIRITGADLDAIPRYHFKAKRDEILADA